MGAGSDPAAGRHDPRPRRVGGVADDPHYFVVDGRRWRTTDPGIPDRLRVELVAELMAARRAVRDHATDARARVQDAKVALGERGEPWWEDPSPDGRDERLAASMLVLLRHRDPSSTICPSDVSRVVAGEGFRAVMDDAQSRSRTACHRCGQDDPEGRRRRPLQRARTHPHRAWTELAVIAGLDSWRGCAADLSATSADVSATTRALHPPSVELSAAARSRRCCG